MGQDEYNNFMLSLESWLRNHKALLKNPYSKWHNNPRFINITVCALHFYKRIYSYTYTLPLRG